MTQVIPADRNGRGADRPFRGNQVLDDRIVEILAENDPRFDVAIGHERGLIGCKLVITAAPDIDDDRILQLGGVDIGYCTGARFYFYGIAFLSIGDGIAYHPGDAHDDHLDRAVHSSSPGFRMANAV